jgi:two-component system response regulator BaeR
MSLSENILIVEDEVELSEIFRDYLIAEEFEVTLLHSGAGVVEKIRATPPDLVLLDIMLPDTDGITICRDVRKFSNVPIIMVTAKVDEIDRLLGLDIGADDYICKPAKPKEVVARVKAVLRRTRLTPNTACNKRLQLDQYQYLAHWEGEALKLTRVEFRLLNLLAKDPGHIYSRIRMMNVIYDDGRYVSDRSIDSHIKNLRHKLALVSKIKNPIKSVYGVGYKLEIDEQQNDSE